MFINIAKIVILCLGYVGLWYFVIVNIQDKKNKAINVINKALVIAQVFKVLGLLS